jgi:hypothetical protein
VVEIEEEEEEKEEEEEEEEVATEVVDTAIEVRRICKHRDKEYIN